MTEALLQIEDLMLDRGGVPVLEGVSFRVHAGEVVILRGPNGAGKTTLLRSIAGLLPALAGTVSGGSDQVAYAGHDDGLKATLTVEENLRFWARIFGAEAIEEALMRFDLEALRDRMAGTLSAGQKRRAGLARMMLTGRPLWVLDEPTVSLDQTSVTRFAEVIRGHAAAGGAALIATHIDLGLDARVLDITPFRAAAAVLDDAPFAGDDW